MALVAGGDLKHPAAIIKVPSGQTSLDVGKQIVDNPFADNRTSRRFHQRNTAGRLRIQNFFQCRLLLIRQTIDRFLSDVLDEPRERISSAECCGRNEPLEETSSLLHRPLIFQSSQTVNIMNLLFLAGSFLKQIKSLSGDLIVVQIHEHPAQFAIQTRTL